jgi:L-lactate permease
VADCLDHCRGGVLYKVSVKTGQFDIIRSSILSVTEDQRLQLILVGFCFGAFLEGAAGFGAPVAITAALLVGLGFRPCMQPACA